MQSGNCPELLQFRRYHWTKRGKMPLLSKASVTAGQPGVLAHLMED